MRLATCKRLGDIRTGRSPVKVGKVRWTGHGPPRLSQCATKATTHNEYKVLFGAPGALPVLADRTAIGE